MNDIIKTCGNCDNEECNKKCSKCNIQYYCSKICQEVDWSSHINVCCSIPIYVIENQYDQHQKHYVNPDDICIDFISYKKEEAQEWMKKNIIEYTVAWTLREFKTICPIETTEFYYRPSWRDLYPVLYKTAERADKDHKNKGTKNTFSINIGASKRPNDGMRYQKYGKMMRGEIDSVFENNLSIRSIPMESTIVMRDFYKSPNNHKF